MTQRFLDGELVAFLDILASSPLPTGQPLLLRLLSDELYHSILEPRLRGLLEDFNGLFMTNDALGCRQE